MIRCDDWGDRGIDCHCCKSQKSLAHVVTAAPGLPLPAAAAASPAVRTGRSRACRNQGTIVAIGHAFPIAQPAQSKWHQEPPTSNKPCEALRSECGGDGGSQQIHPTAHLAPLQANKNLNFADHTSHMQRTHRTSSAFIWAEREIEVEGEAGRTDKREGKPEMSVHVWCFGAGQP